MLSFEVTQKSAQNHYKRLEARADEVDSQAALMICVSGRWLELESFSALCTRLWAKSCNGWKRSNELRAFTKQKKRGSGNCFRAGDETSAALYQLGQRSVSRFASLSQENATQEPRPRR